MKKTLQVSDAPSKAWSLLLSWVVLGVMVALMSACASGGSGSEANAPRTDSDQTDADRRAGVRMELAAGYFARGQFNTALDEIKQALAVKPDMREAINLRGLVYAAMGEPTLADENFKRALVLYPNDPDTLHNYGWLMCQQQRWADASVKFDQALAQTSYRAPSRTLLAKGVCEARAGRLAEAEKSLVKAFEFDAGSPAVAINLAEVLYRNKQYDRARFYVRRVNANSDQSNAQSLWLEARIERRLGNTVAFDDLSQKMRRHFSQSPETQALNAGRFDE